MYQSPIALAIAVGESLQRVGTADANQLNALVRPSEGRLLVAAPSENVLDSLDATTLSRIDDSSITIVPIGAPSEVSEDWTELPAGIAVRCSPPETAAIVAVPMRLCLNNAGNAAPFNAVDFPIWDWTIRRVDAGVMVRITESCQVPRFPHRRLPRLVPRADDGRRGWLEAHLLKGVLVESPQSRVDAVAVRAGLLQMHDFLDASHRQAQSIEGEGRHGAGDYWHGIMHRREPDYGNAKYWFRRVGTHPVFDDVGRYAVLVLDRCVSPHSSLWRQRLLRASGWDSFAFVDLCEACAEEEDGPLGMAAREIQWQEMRLLLRHTWRDAAGTN